MKGYWLTFTDGSNGYCEGESPWDAVRIAEKLTGKKAVESMQGYQPKVPTLPYPANPIIWQLDHPVNGKCPPFCHAPKKCAGRSSCPQSYACSE